MKPLLRTLTMLIALVASGLALVVVAPAPPASADLRIFTQGSLSVAPNNSAYCWAGPGSDTQLRSSWVRRFDLLDLDVVGRFNPQLVRFGVQQVVPAPGKQSVEVRVRVYAYPSDRSLTSELLAMVPVRETIVNLTAANSGQLVEAEMEKTDLPGLNPWIYDAVVEVFYRGQVAGERFVIGSNREPETTSGFLRSPDCEGMAEYGDHIPDMNTVIAVQGYDDRESDRDGDLVTDYPDEDKCPNHAGPADGDYPGCALLRQRVSATYDRVNDEINGNVSIVDPEGSHDDSCLDQVEVKFFDAATSRLLGGTWTKGASRAFVWRSWGVAENTRVLVFADGFFDRDEASGEGIAQCGSTEESYVTVTGRDGDEDGMPDARDPCPAYWGDPGGGGCPYVERAFTSLTYADGFLRGRLVVTDWGRVPEGAACQGANDVVLVVGTGAPQRTFTGVAAATTGAFAINAGLADTQEYAVTATAGADRELAWCSSGASGALTANVDSDDDLFRDSIDDCDEVDGPALSQAPGCPDLYREITAFYDAAGEVSGKVTFTVAEPQSTWCVAAERRRVEVWSQPSNGQPTMLGEGTYSLDDGRYSITLDDKLADGAGYRVYLIGSLDPDAGWCGAASSGLRSEADDSDGDDVKDAVDACDAVDGPAASPAPGCPVLLREVTASYVGGAVSGHVTFMDKRVPRTACAGEQQTQVQLRVQRDGVVVLVKDDHYSPDNGAYVIDLALPVDAVYRVHVHEGVDPEAGYCASASSAAQVVSAPGTDDDGVTDDVDECDDVDGPAEQPGFPGCPTLERSVSAAYADGMISGDVITDYSACALGVPMQAVETAPDETRSVVDFETGPDGTYVWEPTLGPGSQVQIVAVRALEPSRLGVCRQAQSGNVQLPDQGDDHEVVDRCPAMDGGTDDPDYRGCPTLARTVTASYANGAITGQVSVLGPNSGPAGTCLPTQVRAYDIRDGVPVHVGPTTTTTASGSFSMALGGGLAAGSTYFVAVQRYLYEDVAVCGAAESARGQVPTVLDPPGGSVPEAGPPAPVLSGVKLTKKVIHVVGSRVKPRATTIKLRLNVAATVVVKVTGTAKTTGRMAGRKTRAKVSTTLGAGASSVKLASRLGKTRLPPGVYRVTVRATNAVGAATAAAGRLTIRP